MDSEIVELRGKTVQSESELYRPQLPNLCCQTARFLCVFAAGLCSILLEAIRGSVEISNIGMHRCGEDEALSNVRIKYKKKKKKLKETTNQLEFIFKKLEDLISFTETVHLLA